MALEIFKLVGSIFIDNDEANKSIAKTDEKAQGVGSTLANGVKNATKWGTAIVGAATAATGAAVAITKPLVDSYANYEQLEGGVETLFKDSADTVKKYADGAYKTAGMSANQYMETVTGFSASLLQGLDGDTQKAASVADMAITDMSDNANKMGTDMSMIQNAYQGFAKQNYTMLDNLKLGYGGTKSEMERLLVDAEKLSGQKYDISNLNDVYEAVHVIQTEMGITGTTAKEAESTISGGMGMIKAKMENLKTNLGASLAPVAQKFITLIIDKLPQIEALIDSLLPTISMLLEGVLPPLIDLAEQIFPLIVSLIQAIMPTLIQIVQAILPVIVQLCQMFLPPLVQIIQTLLPPLMMMLQPILDLLVPLLELLQPILDLLISILDPIVELINGLLTPLMNIIKKVIEVAIVPLKQHFSNLAGVLSGTVKGAIDLIMSSVEMIKGVFSGVIQFIKGVFTGDWESAWEGVKKIFSSIWEGIKNAFKIPINWIIDGINIFIRALNKIKVPDWVPLVGGKGINIGEIPHLEKGAVLEKGQTGFLEGNGAEAVVPLEKNKKWISAVAADMDNAIGGSSSKRVEARLTDILQALEDLLGMGIYLDTGALVGGLARPMDKKLGQLQLQKARG